MACNFINNEILCAFTGLPSVGSIFPIKAMAGLCFRLK